MKSLSILLGATLLATGTAASAQSANDARCIVLATTFASQSKEAEQQKLAEATLYFYLGRIAGTPTAAQLKASLDAQAKTLTDTNAGQLMGECVKPVQAKVAVLQSLAGPPPAAAQPAAPATKPSNPQGR